MNTKSIKYIIYTALFAIPFVPLLVSSSLFFPFITGKAFAFRILVEIAFAAYLVLAIRDHSYRPNFSWMLGSVLVFLAVIGVADIFAMNSYKAFWSNYERMEGFLTMVHLVALFVVMGSVLKTQELWNRLIATSLFGSFIMSVYSFSQLAGKITINQGGVRVDGTLGNASYLGIYMVFHIFFAALLFVRSRETWKKVVIGVVGLMNLIILYHTATRGAILGLIGGAVISFIYLAIKSEKGSRIRKITLAGIVSIVMVVGIFFAAKNTSFVQTSPVLSRFASLSFSDIKNQGRYYVWPMAIKGFVEKPVLGWGQEGFNFVFNKYYDPKMYNQEPWFDRAHNTFLDWLIAGGLLGLLSYVGMLTAFVVSMSKASDDKFGKEDKAIMYGLLAAYVFNNLFVFDQISSYILFFTILAYAHSHSVAHNSLWDRISDKFRNIFDQEKWHPVFEAFVLIGFVLVLYVFVINPWRQNKSLLNVLKLNSQGQVGSIETYSKPLSKYSMSFPEALEHISQTAMALQANQNVSADLKQQLFQNIDKAFALQIEKNPNDARYRLFYGLFLSRFGWYGRAVEQLETAQKLSPNKQSIYFELANNYLLNNNGAQALEAAKTAYEIEPSYTEAKLVYGLVATASGNTALGNKILSEINESEVVFDDRYLNLLLSMGETGRIIELAKKRVSLDPSNMQHRITLAAAYLQANRRQDAILVIQEMIKLDPSFKEKGDYYIGEIKAGRNP